MTSKINDLIRALSRIPGLSFLRQYTRHITTATNVKKSIDAFKTEDKNLYPCHLKKLI